MLKYKFVSGFVLGTSEATKLLLEVTSVFWAWFDKLSFVEKDSPGFVWSEFEAEQDRFGTSLLVYSESKENRHKASSIFIHPLIFSELC